MSSWSAVKQAESVKSAEQLGAEWTGAEMRRLAEMRESGRSVAEMAVAVGRSYYAVATRLQVAGLVERRQARPVAAVAACEACWLVHRGECR